jgi:putative inorganic carbon (HCO3(-)) transporter
MGPRAAYLWQGAPAAVAVRGRGPLLLWALALSVAALAGGTLGRSPGALLVMFAVVIAGAAAALAIAAIGQPRWALLGLLIVLVPYAPEVLSRSVGSPKLFGYMLLALLAVVIVARAALRVESVRLPHVAWLLAALAAVMVLSSVQAANPGIALGQVADFAREATLVVLMVALLGRREWLERVVWVFLVTVGILGLLTVFQQATATYAFDFMGFVKVDPDSGALHRSQGPVTANFFGQILLVATTFGIYAGIAAERRSTRIVAWSLAPVCVLAIGFTASRGALIGLAVVLLLVICLRRPRASTIAIGAVGLAVVFSGVLGTEYRDRLGAFATSVGGPAAGATDTSVRNRIGENLAAVRMFSDSPILGVGPDHYLVHYLDYSEGVGLDSRPEARRPHSLYLEALSELGLVGALVFFTILAVAVRAAWRARSRLPGRHGLYAEAAFVGLIGFLISGVFLHAAFPRYLWIVVAIALIAGEAARAHRLEGEALT